VRTSKLDSLSVNERKDGLCYVDRQAINLHVYAVDIDHIIALARGGADDESNWALAHAACNRSKGTRAWRCDNPISTCPDWRREVL
jgi:5-methylcytosine-specific restriction endonuclease McrA